MTVDQCDRYTKMTVAVLKKWVKLVNLFYSLDNNFHFVFLSSCIKNLIIESRMILER